MLKYILQFILVLVSSLLIYLSNNYFIVTSLFFLIIIFTLNKNPFTLLSIIPLFTINQNLFFVYLLFYILLYVTEKKIYKKKYKIPSFILIVLSTTLITYILVEYDYRIIIMSLVLSIALILLNISLIKDKNSISNEVIMLILFSLNTTAINLLIYTILFTCFIISSSIKYKTKYYLSFKKLIKYTLFTTELFSHSTFYNI